MSNRSTLTSSDSDVISQQQSNSDQAQSVHIRSTSSDDISQVQEGSEQEENESVIPQPPPPQGDSSMRGLGESVSPHSQLLEPVVLSHNPLEPTPSIERHHTKRQQGQAPYLRNEYTNGNEVRSSSSKQLPRLNTSLSSTPRSNIDTVMTPGRKTKDLDPRNPLVVLMPASAQPTEVLANRFSAWRSVIKSIITYLTEIASIQDEVVRQQLRLTHAVQFPFFTADGQQPGSSEEKMMQSFFMPAGAGSIQQLPSVLNEYHGAVASHASRMSRELTNDVVPRLEDLRRDLLVKIKEIKSLQSDFKNSCFKELQQTKIDMKHYVEAIEEAHHGSPKQDPYLAKIVLDRQIRKQLSEENFVHEAFDNLESSGGELENVVVMEIQNSLTNYARLLSEEAQMVFDILLSKLDGGFFNKDPEFEWKNFIKKDPNFIAPNLPMRRLKKISYKYQFDPLSYGIRSGVLERRSKFLKSYSKGYYVLTPNYLHEFKTSDRKKDQIPMMSLSLNECTVTEHSKPSSSDDKFVLHAKQNGIIHRGHNWVFRTDSFDSMMAWFEDLKALTSLKSLKEKNKFLQERLSLTADGKPKHSSMLASPSVTLPRVSTDRSLGRRTSGATSGYSGPPLQNSQSDFYGGGSFAPRLDNQTNTTTTSSLPDTNELDMSNNSMGNVYADSLENGTHKL